MPRMLSPNGGGSIVLEPRFLADTISNGFVFVRMLLRFCPSRLPHLPSLLRSSRCYFTENKSSTLLGATVP
jgi:hypothetical protein